MRRKINGKVYNIDTADEVLVGELVGGETLDWWGLYRKRNGEFFQVTFSADGEQIIAVEPLADSDAEDLLGRHAPELMEHHFGTDRRAGACEKKVTLRLSGYLVGRLEELAKSHKLSINAYAAKCLAHCLADR
jgi:hypothetical protein